MAAKGALSKIHTFADDLDKARLSRTTTATTKPVNTPVTNTSPTSDSLTTASNPTKSTKPVVQKNNKSSVTKLTSSSDRDASYPATIITDKKNKSFNLTAEVSSAIGDWWNDKIATYKNSKKPIYKVATTERRKGVIEEATTYTGRATTTDHQQVATHLKEISKVKEVQTNKPIQAPSNATTLPVAQTITPTIPQWETAQIALDDKNITNSDILTKSTGLNEIVKPVFTPINNTFEAAPEVTTQPAVQNITGTPELVVPTTNIETPKKSIVPSIPDINQDTSTLTPPTSFTFPAITPNIPYVAPTESISASVPISVNSQNAFTMLSEVPAPVIRNTPSNIKDNLLQRKEQLAEVAPVSPNNKSFSLLTYVAIATFVAISGGGITYFFMQGKELDTTTNQNSQTNLPTDSSNSLVSEPLAVKPVVSVQLDAPNKQSLFKAIKETAGLGDTLHIVTPLAFDTSLPITSREIMTLINRGFGVDFLGNVQNIRMGMIKEDPALIININNKDHARGHMFQWEKTMSYDLNPWFGIAIRNTSTTNQSDFIDGQLYGIDIRILKDDLGSERIVYGFAIDDTIIVTSNSESFASILNSYKSY